MILIRLIRLARLNTSPQPPPKEGERLPAGQLGMRQCKFVQTFWRSIFPSFGGVRGGEFGQRRDVACRVLAKNALKGHNNSAWGNALRNKNSK